MAIRVKHTVNVRVAEDANMDNLLFAPKADLAEVTVDSFDRVASGNFQVEADTTETLPTGDVAVVRGLYLRVDNDCLVNVNGLGTFQMRRSSSGAGVVAKLFLEGEISSVTIKAPVTSPVHGVWCVWGDPTA